MPSRKKNVPDHEELWNSMKKYCFNYINIDEKIIKYQPCEAMVITNTTSQFSENQFLLEFIIYNVYYYHCIQDISYIMSTSEKQGNNHCYQKTNRCQLQPLMDFTGNRYTFLWVTCIYSSSYFVVINKRDLIQTMNINIFLIHRCLLSLQVFIQPF